MINAGMIEETAEASLVNGHAALSAIAVTDTIEIATGSGTAITTESGRRTCNALAVAAANVAGGMLAIVRDDRLAAAILLARPVARVAVLAMLEALVIAEGDKSGKAGLGSIRNGALMAVNGALMAVNGALMVAAGAQVAAVSAAPEITRQRR